MAMEHHIIAREALGVRSKRSGNLRCPHCDAVAEIRSSEPVTATHRIIYYDCTNTFCGHTWRASLSYEYGLVPSAIPDPAVNLPLRIVPREQVLDALRERDANQPDMFDAEGGSNDD